MCQQRKTRSSNTEDYWSSKPAGQCPVDRLAYREDYPLLQATKPARFATCTDAQRAADAHELDLFPNAKVIEDGLSWLPDPEIDWRSVPHLVEEHVNRQRNAVILQSSRAR
jgi:hypothetical protein